MTALIAALAFAVERLFGYPAALQLLIGHPVEWIGRLIGLLDRRLNHGADAPAKAKLAGIVALAVVLILSGLLAGIVTMLCRTLPFGFVIEALIASAFLASRQLGQAVEAVSHGLRTSLSEGHLALQPIVGRDARSLDTHGTARAGIETLAENTSDGIIAPLLFLAVLGLPGIVLYKAINTADSMLGHLTPRHREFGWASARLDDWVNYLPARLTARLIALSARICGEDATAALETARRDAPLQDSPNSGWPEAAMAGALGLKLGGPRDYRGQTLDLPFMGDGRAEVEPDDIDRALRLYRRVNDVALGVLIAAVLAFTRIGFY